MKLLTVAIPCYNSQDYMEKCINSLLAGGEEVEILIINDGSHDRTAEIADEYAEKYPGIVRAIHQENGGHGEAVNAGVRNASGLYYKVVDSDDWVGRDEFLKVLQTIEGLVKNSQVVDLLISNFIYDKQGSSHKKVMQYRHYLPTDKVFGWNEVKRMPKWKYFLMHSLIYRTQLLRDCGMELPKHTFYVDNIFAFEPFPYVKSMYYLDVNLYHYFIGREDQSVNEQVMIRRIDQQLKVNKRMVDIYHECKFPNNRVKAYMFNYLDIITAVSSTMLIRSGTEEALEKKKELKEYIKNEDKKLYKKLRYGFLGMLENLPGRGGRKLYIRVYKLCQKLYGFN